MTYDQLIRHFGSPKAAAHAIGIKPPSVYEWEDNGIPLPRQAQYELVTNGALKAKRPASQQAA